MTFSPIDPEGPTYRTIQASVLFISMINFYSTAIASICLLDNMKSLYLFSGAKSGNIGLKWFNLDSKQPKRFASFLLFELSDLPQETSGLGIISLKSGSRLFLMSRKIQNY